MTSRGIFPAAANRESHAMRAGRVDGSFRQGGQSISDLTTLSREKPFGEWEGDLMIFERGAGKMNVDTLAERKTRFAVLFRNNDRSTTHLMRGLMAVMEPLPQPARQSITFDRGIEFRDWRKLEAGIGTTAWFCDPQAPWQDGSVETPNERARHWPPGIIPSGA
ncbi:IS30 family transposase [Salipiger bermudensis]|uniref:IS30 family transposase n=1 Tax=Salipiger bermudensis TaxID=344736 RepID=UPI001CD270EF|nr:IS30 family transposase [Salipiger bermudensis]MCA0964081.1 IS30 family transposase [Salipiger bermudensis]